MTINMQARHTRAALVGAGVILLLSVLAVVAVYALPTRLQVDLGQPGDTLALPDTTHQWNADEADATYRFRWTTAHSTVLFQDIGTSSPLIVSFRGQGFRPDGAAPAVVTVTVNSSIVATYTLSNDTQIYETPAINVGAASSVLVGFDSTTFRPAGDRRDLGFKLDWVEVSNTPAGLVPPLRVLLAIVVLILGLFAILLRVFGRLEAVRSVIVAGLLSVVVLLVFAAGLYWFRPLVTPWLSPVALLVGLIGLLFALWPVLQNWPDWVDSLAMPKGYAAGTILALALLAFGLFFLSVLPLVEDIGHADYADNAVVARNLAEGHGLVVEYAAQFYKYYPNITHPADTWPLFQPLITAPFFALLGAQTWVAKLPNLLLLLLLSVAVFAFGSRWWDKRVGLLAALLTLLHPYFLQTVIYPINDLAFALFALLALGWIWEASNAAPLQRRFALRQTADGAADVADDESAEPGLRDSGPRIRMLVLAGLASGLLIWTKSLTGILLLVGPAALLLWRYRFGPYAGRPQRASLRQLVWYFAPFLLVLAPLIIRNFVDFGAPFYSTESIDAWILRFTVNGASPWEDIYRNYLPQAAFNGEFPNFRWVTGGKYSYDLLWLSVSRGFQDVWNDAVLKGNVLGLPLFLAALGGWIAAPRRIYPLARLALAAFVPYGVIVLLGWHYESRYFQALVPWAYLGVAGLIFWAWDNARRLLLVREQDLMDDDVVARSGRWAQLLLPVALVALFLPAYFSLSGDIEQVYTEAQTPSDFVTAANWVAANLPADAVVMTRNPWEFNWYSRHKAVMIPEGTITDVQNIGSLYNVGYIWLGGPIDGINKNPPLRPAIAGLYKEQPVPGLTTQLVYRNNSVIIYRWER